MKCAYTIGVDLISQEREGQVSVYVYDGHGSVVGLATMSGKVTDTYKYDAFGNLLKSTGKTANNYLYCGEQFDSTTGLYYLRARYMDTSTGRFISQDSYAGSISDPVSLHKYLYANSNPVMYTDPSGYVAAAVVQAAIVSAIGGMIISTATAYLSNVFALRDATGEFDWSWNLSTGDVCMCIVVGGAFGALGAIALMCQFVVATSILIASAVGFGLFSAYERIENAKNGNISTAIFQGTLALISIFSACDMANTMGGWNKPSKMNKPTTTSSDNDIPNDNLRFGDNDLDLGLNPELQMFKQNGGKGYGEFPSNSKSNGFCENIRNAMNQSDKIRFNLDGVDFSRVNNYNGETTIYNEPINGNYTNYELWLIRNNPGFLNKTVFYQNGKEVPPPKYFE